MSNFIQNSSKQRSPLTFYERQIIETRLRGQWTRRRIASYLGRNHSIVLREIKRNKSPDGKYIAVYAQRQAERQSRKTNKKKLDKDFMLNWYVANQLANENWSPEQIAGRIKEHPPSYLNGSSIGHEAIYRYIYNSPYGKHLYHYLRRKKAPKRRKRFSRKKRQNLTVPERVSIHLRPEIINQRKRFGDWESDSAQFRKQKAGLSVQHERKSMLTRIHKIADGTAEETKEALLASIESLPPELWESITFDNGKEAARHMKIRDEYKLETFFCDPYKAWQKGGVENSIGLIRQYLPKRTRLDTISSEEIYQIQERLNNRPRKKLRYLTPNEVIRQYLNPKSGA